MPISKASKLKPQTKSDQNILLLLEIIGTTITTEEYPLYSQSKEITIEY